MTIPRGFIRSAAAASRTVEKEHQRKVREAAKRFRQQLSQHEMHPVEQAVQDYNGYVVLLRSMHRNMPDTIDWKAIRKEPAPAEPAHYQLNELQANMLLQHYKPSFFEKLFKRQKKKAQQLRQEIIYARIRDRRHYENSLVAFLQARQHWTFMQQMADSILSGDPQAYEEALLYFNPFADIKELGSAMALCFQDDQVRVCFQVNGDHIIPDYILSLTGGSRLSKKEMAISSYNELYRDYVCSAVLRLASEIFAYLPVPLVIVNVTAPTLNTSTGKREEKPVVSIALYRDVLDQLQLEVMEPADAMRHFVHHMRFSKIGGFSEVEEVDVCGSRIME